MGGDRGVSSVLEALEAVIEESWRTRSRDGYFACLYHKVTQKVAEGIATGFFDDPERMERLDIAFAQRYFDARDALRTGRRPTRSWEIVFEAARQRRHVIAQHLLVAINAHINLDLGIATARVSTQLDLPSFRDDYVRVNRVLFALLDELQDGLGSVSPWMSRLDRLGLGMDELCMRSGIAFARSQAWELAEALVAVPEEERWPLIAERDAWTARLGKLLCHRLSALHAANRLVAWREPRDQRLVIDALAAPRIDVVALLGRRA